MSTHYISMIEIKRKFPKPEMLEQIADALEIDVSTLFSVPPDQLVSLKKLQQTILEDINIEVGVAEAGHKPDRVFRSHGRQTSGIYHCCATNPGAASATQIDLPL